MAKSLGLFNSFAVENLLNLGESGGISYKGHLKTCKRGERTIHEIVTIYF